MRQPGTLLLLLMRARSPSTVPQTPSQTAGPQRSGWISSVEANRTIQQIANVSPEFMLQRLA